MKLKLDYGKSGLEVDLPSDRLTIITPSDRPALPDQHAALVSAIGKPLGSKPLRELYKASQRVAVSVCDITRAQPRERMLRALFEEMPGIKPQDVTILIATGTHRANTQAELDEMLGPEFARSCRVINHDSLDASMLRHVGQTSTGVPIYLNRDWLEADFRITTGFVEPHFFAGFSGGPKLVAPGLAGIETVMYLHDAERIGNPAATWGVTEGNPVHDDVREIARMTGVDFALDVTLNRQQEITAVFAGDLMTEHAAACEAARRDAMQPVAEPFDVVVTTNSGYPLDQNLYQSVKGMSAAARVVKPGGTIICAAECRDGLPDHGSYADLLRARPTPGELLEMINEPGFSVPDQWEVQVQAIIQQHARVLIKTGYLTDEQLREAHLEQVDDVEAAVRDALRQAGSGATLCVLPQGPQTIPYLED